MMQRLASFIRGMGSVVNIWPGGGPHRFGGGIIGRSDEGALRGDWEKVGGDLMIAMERGAKEIGHVEAKQAPAIGT